jgi:hypothetical protein
LNRFDGLARQLLELFKAPALLFEQAILTLTDQVGITGSGSGMDGIEWRKA